MVKKKIKLWEMPLKLANSEKTYQVEEEEPLHSCGLSVFQDQAVIVSNSADLFAAVGFKTDQLDDCIINRENYNPYRIGN